jgi:aminobenzoyl-glutamate utilization protein B
MDTTQWIEEKKEKYISLSDQVWELAEMAYHEEKSAGLLADALEEGGFEVERGIGGIPTAFVASYGTGKPVLAILGEYDALAGLSQEPTTKRKPVAHGEPGHGCGHNLLGVAGLAAAAAVKESMDADGLKGTIRYYGCPAEENGSGKAFMVKAGVFDDVDLSLTWHPGKFNVGSAVNFLANYKIKFKFKGVPAHAAADPHNGRSALDAVELMNVGVNYLREHIITDARIHYAILNPGGLAPNVVQAEAESLYIVRAPKVDQLVGIYERVQDVAKGAALMTGTELEINFHAGASNLILNETIVDVLVEKMHEVGAPKFNASEKKFAEEISKTFPEGGSILSGYEKLLGDETAKIEAELKGLFLHEDIFPSIKKDIALPGSTDVGDVSWVTPTGQFSTACYALGTPGHSWQLVAQGGMSIGHTGMVYAAKILALSALEFMGNSELLQKAKDEFQERRKDNPFISPIPDGVTPPLD